MFIWLTDNSGSSNRKRVTVMDYQMNVIVQEFIDPSLATTYDIDLTSEGDNVYIVTVEEELSVNSYDTSHVLVIYEYCALENCTWFTIDKILCSSEPCTEVCNPCSPESVLQQQKNRQSLNQLIATFGSLMAYIHVERTRYLGIFDYNADRENFVTKIGMLLTKVKHMALQCGSVIKNRLIQIR